MLLETLDIKKNDVVIFSQNIFDLEKNFKIIYKDDPKKEIRSISYNEVCQFINEFTPKNIIIYRLLTNIKDFEIYLPKYGYILTINTTQELIYFDPVFAIRELQEYNQAVNYFNIRFRIQQIGLTTLNRTETSANYAEIYSIDLESSEALNQNDKVFADALFANYKIKDNKKINESLKRKSYTSKSVPLSGKSFAEKIPKLNSKGTLKENKIISSLHTNKETIGWNKKVPIDNIRISEDLDFDYKKIEKIPINSSNHLIDKNEISSGIHEIKYNLKVNITETPFSKFLDDKREGKTNNIKFNLTKENPIINIFKDSISLNKIKEKENQHYVLKIDTKRFQ